MKGGTREKKKFPFKLNISNKINKQTRKKHPGIIFANFTILSEARWGTPCLIVK